MLEWLVLTIDRSAPRTSGNAGGPSDAPDLKISLLKAVRFVYGVWYEVRQTTIQNCFRKAGFVRQDQPPSSSDSDSETGTETADLTELWEHVPTVDADSGCVASVEDFPTADSAASFYDELIDEAIVADVLSRQAAALCDGSDSSDEEVDSASTTPSMTTQAEDRTVANLFGVERSTVNTLYRQFCEAVVAVLEHKWIKMVIAEEMARHIQKFEAVTGFHQGVGALDGCHFPISPPKEHATDYYNYKGWYSIILLALVDHRYRFRYINVGAPGRCHDSHVFGYSRISNAIKGPLLKLHLPP
ncbi:hypothetical protein MRX96_046009 [Rhipicephalus microplus]